MNRRQLITALAALPFVRHIVSAPPVQAEPEPYSMIALAEDEAQYVYPPAPEWFVTPRYDAGMPGFRRIVCCGTGRIIETSPGVYQCQYTTNSKPQTFTASVMFLP
jgi:hypothetical protein